MFSSTWRISVAHERIRVIYTCGTICTSGHACICIYIYIIDPGSTIELISNGFNMYCLIKYKQCHTFQLSIH